MCDRLPALGCVVLLMVTSAQAALLTGQTVQTTFYYPDLSTVYSVGGGPVNSLVGPGVELTTIPGPPYIASIDMSDTSILLTMTYSGTGYVSQFNGWQFSDVNGTIPPIGGASLTTDMSGIVLTFDTDNIWLNFSGVTYSPARYARVDLTAIPEPGVMWLLGGGVMTLCLRRRKSSLSRIL